MTEFYAKIVPLNKGAFRYCATIWKSHDGIDSIWNKKKFIRVNAARSWSSKHLAKLISKDSQAMFIKESDILRRKWND
jgi:hypothetical protein